MKQKASKMIKKITFYTLYVPCVLLDAICRDIAAACSTAKVIFANRKVLFESAKADLTNAVSRIKNFKIRKASGAQRSKAKVRTPLSKKMFVSSATMVVSAILLLAVSYGQYKIMIPGEIRMPKVAEFNQSAFLYPTLDNYDSMANEGDPSKTVTGTTYDDTSLLHKFEYADPLHYGQTFASEVSDADKDRKTDLVYDMYLNELQPGDDVRDIVNHYQNLSAAARQTDKDLLTHSFHLELQNSDKNGNVNQIPSHYTISISSIGSIKLEMILVDNENPNEYYYGVKSSTNTYTFRKITNDSVVSVAGSDIEYADEDAVFNFKSLTDENAKNADLNDWSNTTRDYTIFIGWDNSYENTSTRNTIGTTNSNTNAKSRKEVEVLNIKVTSTGESISNFPDGLITDGTWVSDADETTVQNILKKKNNTVRAQAAAGQNTVAVNDNSYEGEVVIEKNAHE